MSVVALRSLVCTRSTIIYSTTSSANRAIDTALKKKKKGFTFLFLIPARYYSQKKALIYDPKTVRPDAVHSHFWCLAFPFEEVFVPTYLLCFTNYFQ
jgi:hypothetical protein